MQYRVVFNTEEQYSIWPMEKDIPEGWTPESFNGTKEACLNHIETIWTDMRPLSLRSLDTKPSKKDSSDA